MTSLSARLLIPGMTTVSNPLGEILSARPPLLDETQAEALALQYFGVTARARKLGSERDANFHLASAEGEFVLKLVNPAEPAAVTDFQIRALRHLEGAGLPVPRALRTFDGADGVALAEGYLRLLTYLPGLPMHQVPVTPALRRSFAAIAARLSLGLQGFDHPAAAQDLQWDIRHSLRLGPLLAAVPEPERAICIRVLDRFAAEVAPRLGDCRWQVVHNDLNPHNVLVSPDDPERIAGVLDFGDMVHTALICDLGVAGSYVLDPADLRGSLAALTSAYHAELPLQAVEARLLPDLIAARWVTTLAIAHTRAAAQPENAAYILRNAPAASAGLRAWGVATPADLQAATLNAMGITV